MWLNGLIFATVLSVVRSIVTELNVEAAFQGHCGHTSPCEQLCYEIHDGMYECDCIEGYELNKNGYSCEVINTTISTESSARSEEDVLYQKGVLFSAKLENSVNESNFESRSDEDESDEGYAINEITNRGQVLSNSLKEYYLPSDRISLINDDQFDLEKVPETKNTRKYKNPSISQNNLKKNENPSKAEKNRMEKSTLVYNLEQYAKNKNIDKLEKNHTKENHNTKKTTDFEDYTAVAFTYVQNKNPINSHQNKTTELCLLDCGTGGICDIDTNGNSKCLCIFGKSGIGCLEDIKVHIPMFSQKSWLAFPALRGAYKHVQIRVEFRPESTDGVILLTGERDDLTGDFMALLIYRGFLEFWFDCGSGIGNVRSKEKVLLHQWNSVTIYRHRWDAWLLLNHGSRVQGRSKGLFSRITFREPVFLGGTGNITGLEKRLPVFKGMVGCIRRFVANEHEYSFKEHPLGDVSTGFDIYDCSINNCDSHFCEMQITNCIPSKCKLSMDLPIPSFNGSSYLRFLPLGNKALIWLELQVTFKPVKLDGIILYTGHKNNGDFIALTLNNGFVEFSFDLGSGPALVRSNEPVNIEKWHTINLSRTARLAVLKLDQYPEVMTISSNGFWHLSLPYNFYLGGIPITEQLPSFINKRESFSGCIQKVTVNNKSISIFSEALDGLNIMKCNHVCNDQPCGLNAECVPIFDNYKCQCNHVKLKCTESSLFESTSYVNNISSIQVVGLENHKLPLQKNEIFYPQGQLINSETAKNNSTEYLQYLSTYNSTDIKMSTLIYNYNGTNRTDIILGKKTANSSLTNKRSHIRKNRVPVTDLRQNEYLKSTIEHMRTVIDNTQTSYHKCITKRRKKRCHSIGNDKSMYGMGKADMSPQNNTSEVNLDKYEYISLVGRLRKKRWHKNKYFAEKNDKKYFNVGQKNVRKYTINTGKSKNEFLIRDPADDYQTKELVQDMKRILKNRDDNTSMPNTLKPNANILHKTYYQHSSTLKKNVGACFTGTGHFYHYNDADTMSRIISYKIDLNLRLKLYAKSGIILWSGKHTVRTNDDYLSLGVENGYLHFRYNLGSGETNIKFNSTIVSDGLWHRVRAIRNFQEGLLEVDGRKSIIRKSPGKLKQLNTDTGLYVGGMDDIAFYTRRLYSTGMVGCISEIVLAGEFKLKFGRTPLEKAKETKSGNR